MEEPDKWRVTQFPRKKEAEALDFEAWSDSGNFRILRMNFSCGISSCASRPVEAMIYVTEIESAKSIADLNEVVFNHRVQVVDRLRGS